MKYRWSLYAEMKAAGIQYCTHSLVPRPYCIICVRPFLPGPALAPEGSGNETTVHIGVLSYPFHSSIVTLHCPWHSSCVRPSTEGGKGRGGGDEEGGVWLQAKAVLQHGACLSEHTK